VSKASTASCCIAARHTGTGACTPHLPRAERQLAARDGNGLAVAQHHAQQVAVRVLGLLRRPARTAGGAAPLVGRKARHCCMAKRGVRCGQQVC
jgi:hypothetical protein